MRRESRPRRPSVVSVFQFPCDPRDVYHLSWDQAEPTENRPPRDHGFPGSLSAADAGDCFRSWLILAVRGLIILIQLRIPQICLYAARRRTGRRHAGCWSARWDRQLFSIFRSRCCPNSRVMSGANRRFLRPCATSVPLVTSLARDGFLAVNVGGAVHSDRHVPPISVIRYNLWLKGGDRHGRSSQRSFHSMATPVAR